MGGCSTPDEALAAPGPQAAQANGGWETGVKALQSLEILQF